MQERATAQAQLRAMQEGSVQERTRLERQLAKERKGREGAMRVVRTVCARMTVTERDAKQLAEENKQLARKYKQLLRENQELHEER